MKHLVLLSLVLLTVTIGSAQQSNEWRPSIADDNKAATLTDTIDFISHEAKARYWEEDAPRYFYKRSHFIDVVAITSPAACHLAISDREVMEHSPGFTTQSDLTFTTYFLDLKAIDPLSISVASAVLPAEQGKGHLFPAVYQWKIAFSGTNGHNIGEFKVAKLTIHKDADAAAQMTSDVCNGEKACETKNGSAANGAWYLQDQETAHRVARAIMHAALLCGGSKAVSPF